MTLLPRSIPHECTGSCCYQCRAKMRRRILGQISTGFGMTAASMPAKPTLFPIASALVLPTHDQFDTFRCPLMSSAKDGLLRWVDCDTCLLTLKAFAGPCMVYANSFNRCFHLIWRCYCWWCRSYRIVSYRRIPFYQVAMTGQLEHHEHDPSDNSGTKPEQPGVS